MAWIDVIPLDKAVGLLKQQYEAALGRAGRIWHVVSIMSQNPEALRASMTLYTSVMRGESPLSRGQREMLGVVVSVQNQCLY